MGHDMTCNVIVSDTPTRINCNEDILHELSSRLLTKHEQRKM